MRPPDPPEHTDDLVRAVRSGSRHSFDELYGRLAPALHAWATLRLPRGMQRYVAPEELVQEVWCRAVRRFADFDPARAPFRSWMFGFAYRVLREALREGLRLQRTAAPEGSRVFQLDQVPEEATSLTRRVAREDGLRVFLEKLEQLELPAEEREMLMLRGIEGLGYEQVATHLGITAPAARKRWERLRERIARSPVGVFAEDE